ncbi:phosphopantetheine-binding protein [Dickeya dadantii]|uniref:acyl carrier protein n=1 Tax=Dickeya dadantii TaxID=204038 RepID=UPI001CF285CD|nr:phosphopantetheine-binding protein [Dickeya dadantii]MCA7014963.1 phosphopantetheine-binding protein [Dickeya dadantii]
MMSTNHVETQILRHWRDIMKSAELNTTDSFLAQGGNSLHLIKLAALLSKTLGQHVSPGEIFAAGNIRQLAQHLTEKEQ